VRYIQYIEIAMLMGIVGIFAFESFILVMEKKKLAEKRR